ncbi:MAG: alpha-amylase [Bacteroidetes bacterium]|nr:alpha-amylase [Bacteroidota bacterium]
MIRTLLLIFVLGGTLFSHTLIGQVLEAPEWARGMVWYLVMPDRFENGDTPNDPTAAYVFDDQRIPWKVSEWTANWYERSIEEKMLHEEFYSAAMLRQYGGDLDGLIGRLDYLRELGVQGLILTPMFVARSAHKFDVASYHHIDRHFGPVTDADTALLDQETLHDPSTWRMTSADRRFVELIAQAHRRDMRVLMMAQFAHVGVHFRAFRDVLKKQEKSLYGDWFVVRQWDRPETPFESEFQYKNMWGIDAFPVLQQDTLGLVAGPRDHIFAATQRWMDPDGDGDPSDGIDGWCIDLAGEIPEEFWREWTDHCRSINPDVLLVNMNQAQGNTVAPFDIDNTRQFGKAVSEFLLSRIISSTTLDSRLMSLRSRTTLQSGDVLWNLIDFHETDRLASMCVNDALPYDRHNTVRRNPTYQIRPPDESEQDLRRVLLLLQFTLPGSPVIYYGNEAGMWGGDDPDNRKPMLWPDRNYAHEVSFEVNGDLTPYPNRFDSSLYNYYRKLIQLRKEWTALRSGETQTLLIDDYASLYGFMRTAGAEKVFVIVNAGEEAQPCVLPYLGLPDGVRLYDPFHDLSFYTRRDAVSFVIPGRTATILLPPR